MGVEARQMSTLVFRNAKFEVNGTDLSDHVASVAL